MLLAGIPEKKAAHVLDMDARKRDISGPVQGAMEAFLGRLASRRLDRFRRRIRARRQAVLSSVNRLPASHRRDVVGALGLHEKLHVAA